VINIVHIAYSRNSVAKGHTACHGVISDKPPADEV
jgi:hypothetical protein